MSASRSCLAAARFSSLRAQMEIRHPSSARPSATALPIPLLAAATIARRPEIPKSIRSQIRKEDRRGMVPTGCKVTSRHAALQSFAFLNRFEACSLEFISRIPGGHGVLLVDPLAHEEGDLGDPLERV